MKKMIFLILLVLVAAFGGWKFFLTPKALFDKEVWHRSAVCNPIAEAGLRYKMKDDVIKQIEGKGAREVINLLGISEKLKAENILTYCMGEASGEEKYWLVVHLNPEGIVESSEIVSE